MFMFFNAIVLIVTGLASAAAITADNARDQRCAQPGSAAASECLPDQGSRR